jgi:hypothetical protein
MRRTLLFSILLLIGIANTSWAQIPRTMNYQGVLTDAAGKVVPDGTYQLTFKLYDVSSGGTELWAEIHPSVSTSQGIFNVILGSITALTPPFDKQYWLGLTVATDPELAPRAALTAAPYSLNSGSTSTVAGAVYRWNVFSTYDQPSGWFASNDTDMFGGISPSTWTDGNGIAGNMSSDMEVLRTLFSRKGFGGKNATIVADTWSSYSSTNGKVAVALFRIKNTTGGSINWTAEVFQTGYQSWGELASVAVNGVNVFASTGTLTASSHFSHILSIPGNAISTVIFVSTSSNPNNAMRAVFLAFDNNSLQLPAGLEYVDDLDTAASLQQSF